MKRKELRMLVCMRQCRAPEREVARGKQGGEGMGIPATAEVAAADRRFSSKAYVPTSIEESPESPSAAAEESMAAAAEVVGREFLEAFRGVDPVMVRGMLPGLI